MSELSALAEIAAETVEDLVINPVRTLHCAVSRRAFAATGPGATPVRVIHDGIASAVYASISTVTRATGGAAAAALRRRQAEDTKQLSGTVRGRLALAAINGLIGDRLEERASELAIPMAIRSAHRDVGLGRGELQAAFPDATGHLVVFLPGLFEDEGWWRRGRLRHAGQDGVPFGDRMQEEFGLTPVYLRYNTGAHISLNGRRLAELLQGLVEAWPVPIDKLDLVGHSMGGLVARSACHVGQAAGHEWPSRTAHMVTLGSPHGGAPIAKALHNAAWLLRRVPEASPLGNILDLRSAGIRDLRFGYLSDDDWLSNDPGALLADRASPIALLDNCSHTFITATLTPDPGHPLGRAFGDLLVRTDSAAGRHRTRTIPLPPGSVVQLGGLNHFDLLDHPLVYAQLRRALSNP
jgi:pimeloyl-ACP methyl ester carboxylesterase